jgi:regulator of sigma E protease
MEFLLNNNFLLSLAAFGIMLIPAIIIHELGHFIAAKLVGINVLEFGIGFPPRITSLFIWGETEFTLNWLPIGGFVRPLGEDMIGPVVEDEQDYAESDYPEDKPKKVAYITEREELMSRGVPEEKIMSVNDAKPLPRIFFMAAGAIANVLSAIVFFIIAALLGIPIAVGARVQLAEVPVNSVFDQSPVAQWDAIELIDGEYFASERAFFETWLASSGKPITLTMRHPDDFEDEAAAGARYTITVTPLVDTIEPYVMITGVIENSPAAIAGFEKSDRIVSVNGIRISVDDPIGDVVTAIDAATGIGMDMTVLRDNQTLQLHVVPRENPPPGEGKMGIGIVAQWLTNDGVVFHNANSQVEYIPQPVGDAVAYGFGKTISTFQLIGSIPAQIINGAISPEQARPVSIIGISQLGGQFLQRSILDGVPYYVLEFIALISIFLGISNILPLFPLPVDGTRIVFVIIEMLRGKPIPLRIENAIYRVGLAILLILSIAVIILDIFFPLI